MADKNYLRFNFVQAEKKPPKPLRFNFVTEWELAVDASVRRLESAQKSLQELMDYAMAHDDVREHHPAIKTASGLLDNVHQLIGRMRGPGAQREANR